MIIFSRKKMIASHKNISYAAWNPAAQTIDVDAVQKADYIVHLAGANVGQGRWTKKRKKEIIDSRVQSGQLLAKALQQNSNHVKAVISMSAIGWYGPDAPDELAQIEWRLPADRPLIFSELGAGAKYGMHDTRIAPHKYSEEYQLHYYNATLAMAGRIPTLAGLSPWILKDFRSPRRQLPEVQEGWNRKGLISETGERKMAFEALARWYANKRRQAGAE